MSARQKRFSWPLIWSITVWLIVGPFLCRYLFNAVGLWLPPTQNYFINNFGRPILGAALVGIAVFLLPLTLWQRVMFFVFYALIAGVGTAFVVAMLTSM